MGVEKYTTPGGKIAWMVDLTATLPSGQEVRFRQRKIATKEQARALEAKKFEEIFQGTYFEQRRASALTVRQLWEQYEPITKRDNSSFESDQGRAECILSHLGDREAMKLRRGEHTP